MRDGREAGRQTEYMTLALVAWETAISERKSLVAVVEIEHFGIEVPNPNPNASPWKTRRRWSSPVAYRGQPDRASPTALHSRKIETPCISTPLFRERGGREGGRSWRLICRCGRGGGGEGGEHWVANWRLSRSDTDPMQERPRVQSRFQSRESLRRNEAMNV